MAKARDLMLSDSLIPLELEGPFANKLPQFVRMARFTFKHFKAPILFGIPFGITSRGRFWSLQFHYAPTRSIHMQTK